MPRGREPGLGIEKTDGNFVLAGGLMNGEAQVVGESIFDRAGESLTDIMGQSSQFCRR